jgi:hypothetical protein
MGNSLPWRIYLDLLYGLRLNFVHGTKSVRHRIISLMVKRGIRGAWIDEVIAATGYG